MVGRRRVALTGQKWPVIIHILLKLGPSSATQGAPVSGRGASLWWAHCRGASSGQFGPVWASLGEWAPLGSCLLVAAAFSRSHTNGRTGEQCPQRPTAVHCAQCVGLVHWAGLHCTALHWIGLLCTALRAAACQRPVLRTGWN